MSWVGQTMFDAYLVYIVGSLAVMFAAILLATAELSSSGEDRASPEVLPGRKLAGTRPE
jgi:hypothetical protein